MIPLDEEDKMFLRDQRNSAHFRVYKKAIEVQLARETSAMLANTDVNAVIRGQGILLGLKKALAILEVGSMDPEEYANNVRQIGRPTKLTPSQF